jgi:transposase InsO family protein
MKYSFITQHKKTWPVDVICRPLGVTRGGYYRHLKKAVNYYHLELIETVKEIAEASDNTYGSRRMKAALDAMGYPVSRNKAKRLMKEAGIHVKSRKKFKVTTDSNHAKPVFDNRLNRDFAPGGQNQAYVQDITYLWTQEGWLYLATVIDLYSRRVVGWSMSSRMTAQLVCDALKMAIWQRRPDAGLIVHSDRGSQYASKAYRQLLKSQGFIGSMSRKGNCWDNAVAESFFGSLKQERVQWRNYQTRYEAQQDVMQYITMWYNRRRLHSYLGNMSPNQFEMEMLLPPLELQKAS